MYDSLPVHADFGPWLESERGLTEQKQGRFTSREIYFYVRSFIYSRTVGMVIVKLWISAFVITVFRFLLSSNCVYIIIELASFLLFIIIDTLK